MNELYVEEALKMSEVYQETGTPEPLEEDLKVQEQEHEALNNAAALELMVAQPGWKLLENWINQSVNQYKEAIVFEQDLERLVHYQEAVKAYRSCVNWVHGTIAEATKVLNDNADNPEEDLHTKE